jgi:hypothetical protein
MASPSSFCPHPHVHSHHHFVPILVHNQSTAHNAVGPIQCQLFAFYVDACNATGLKLFGFDPNLHIIPLHWPQHCPNRLNGLGDENGRPFPLPPHFGLNFPPFPRDDAEAALDGNGAPWRHKNWTNRQIHEYGIHVCLEISLSGCHLSGMQVNFHFIFGHLP